MTTCTSSSLPALSVVLCTHNPRVAVLQRVIEHLKEQDLPCRKWEFLLIDNASTIPLADPLLVGWHPEGKIIREKRVGLTWARFRAFQEATADWLVFVDDDNLLNPDYLTNCAESSGSFQQLGVFGSGQIDAEFESSPEPWMAPFLPFLALRDLKREAWSNRTDFDAFPCGAGMAIRRSIGLAYYSDNSSGDAMKLGRCGGNMAAGDDTALVLASIEKGLGSGVFPELGMIHVIPRARLERKNLERLATGISQSLTRLKLNLGLQPRSFASYAKAVLSGALQLLRHRRDWRFHWCILKGELRGWKDTSTT